MQPQWSRFCDFFHDSMCNGAKAVWLRIALGLKSNSENSVVEEHLRNASVHVVTVLQSLVSNRNDATDIVLSPRLVACVALFLYLQDQHCKEALGDWQPFRVQERSARCTQSTGTLKR